LDIIKEELGFDSFSGLGEWYVYTVRLLFIMWFFFSGSWEEWSNVFFFFTKIGIGFYSIIRLNWYFISIIDVSMRSVFDGVFLLILGVFGNVIAVVF